MRVRVIGMAGSGFSLGPPHGDVYVGDEIDLPEHIARRKIADGSVEAIDELPAREPRGVHFEAQEPVTEHRDPRPRSRGAPK